MKKIVMSLAVFAAVALTGGTASAVLSVPTLTDGDFFEVTEQARIESDAFLGQGSYLQLDVSSVYEVVGQMDVTQEKTGITTPFTCYHLEGSGDLDMSGNVNITNPLPITGPARIQNGTYEADTYIEVTTFKTVKKKRVFSGQAQYQLPSGVWFTIGELVITENEEYNPALAEIPFPLSAGASGNGTFAIAAFGSINAAGLLNSDFDVPLDISAAYTTAAGSVDVGGTSYDSIKVTHTDAAQGVTIENDYVCEASSSLKYNITNLPLGDSGKIKYFTTTVTAFDVATSSCGGSTGGTTYALTSPKTNYTAGDAVKWDLVYTNTGSAAYNGTAYILLDVAGSWYWLNATTKNLVAFGAGIEQTSTTCAAAGTNTYNLLEFASFPSLGVGAPGFPITWYSASVDTGTGTFGEVKSITTYHP